MSVTVPEHFEIRRKYLLTPDQRAQLEADIAYASEVKDAWKEAWKRAMQLEKRMAEAKTMVDGEMTRMKIKLQWATADYIEYDEETGELCDIGPSVNPDGTCKNCGQIHEL